MACELRINYCEQDNCDFDEHIYCEKCYSYVYEYCSIHGPLLIIPDNKVPDKPPEGIPRAALTVPNEFLHINRSSIPGAGLGVFASLALPKGVRFGPFRGDITTEVNSDYCWQIYHCNRTPRLVVDACDMNNSNWMRFVNCARAFSEQNLLAFQYKGQIYYRTIKVIPRFTELLVFYGSEYAHKLNVNLGGYHSTRKLCEKSETEVLKISNVDTITNNKTQKDVKLQHKDVSQEKLLNIKVGNIKTQEQNNDKPYHIEHERLKEGDASLTSNENVAPNVEETAANNDNKTQRNKMKTKNSKENISEMTSKDVYFICDLCQFKTVTARTLQKHKKLHDLNRKFVCDVCDFRFLTNLHLMQHQHIHNTKSHQSDQLNIRLGNPSGEKPYLCNVCNYKCNKACHLKTHLRIHTGEKPYSCNICNYKFSQAGSLKTHLRTHTGEKPYSCNICNYKCNQSSNLETHLRTHTGEKLYLCNVCNYKCNRADKLKTHLRTHTGEKPYSCNICNYKCNEAGSLKRHLRTHTGEKPYSCNICNYKYSTAGYLKTHLRTHTGEKPYSCNICNYKCNQSSNLKTHLRTHTGDKRL